MTIYGKNPQYHAYSSAISEISDQYSTDTNLMALMASCIKQIHQIISNFIDELGPLNMILQVKVSQNK